MDDFFRGRGLGRAIFIKFLEIEQFEAEDLIHDLSFGDVRSCQLTTLG